MSWDVVFTRHPRKDAKNFAAAGLKVQMHRSSSKHASSRYFAYGHTMCRCHRLHPGFGFSRWSYCGVLPKSFLIYASYQGTQSRTRVLVTLVAPFLVLTVGLFAASVFGWIPDAWIPMAFGIVMLNGMTCARTGTIRIFPTAFFAPMGHGGRFTAFESPPR